MGWDFLRWMTRAPRSGYKLSREAEMEVISWVPGATRVEIEEAARLPGDEITLKVLVELGNNNGERSLLFEKRRSEISQRVKSVVQSDLEELVERIGGRVPPFTVVYWTPSRGM